MLLLPLFWSLCRPRHKPATAPRRRRRPTPANDDLHKALKITADEETNWAAVAQAMRDNDAAMHSLVAEGQETKAVRVSAVDDLRRYEKFTQAHVDGLKNLIASFETLYNAMPDSQKATADEVFQRFGHKAGHAHS